MEAPGHGVVLILDAEGGPALLGIPFCLGVPDQPRMLSPLLEVYTPGDPGLDLPGSADTQRLGKNDMGKDERSLGVPYL